MSPIKYYGGKQKLAAWIIDHFPKPHSRYPYIEPFAGGANVLFNKFRSNYEWLNDTYPGLIAMYKSIRDNPTDFISRLPKKPSWDIFCAAKNNQLEPDVNTFVLHNMSRNGAGKYYAESTRIRKGDHEHVTNYRNQIARILPANIRLQGVRLTCQSALMCIDEVFHDTDSVLYLDPPYMLDTRVARDVYFEEMGAYEHSHMLKMILQAKCFVCISGYYNSMYAESLKGWKVYRKDVGKPSGNMKSAATEYLWCNR